MVYHFLCNPRECVVNNAELLLRQGSNNNHLLKGTDMYDRRSLSLTKCTSETLQLTRCVRENGHTLGDCMYIT